MIDILFPADVPDMMIQGRGGLKKEEIFGLYKTRGVALVVAKQLLAKRRKI